MSDRLKSVLRQIVFEFGIAGFVGWVLSLGGVVCCLLPPVMEGTGKPIVISLGDLFDAEFFHFVAHGAEANAEFFGSFGPVASTVVQGFEQQVFFHGLHVVFEVIRQSVVAWGWRCMVRDFR